MIGRRGISPAGGRSPSPLGAWYDFLTYSPGLTAYHYYASKVASHEAPTESGKVSAGYYMEKGPWVYRWNTTTKDITIVLTPTSATPKQVAVGSKAYDAILAVITSGKAKKVAAAEVKRLRAQARATPTASSKLEAATTSLRVGPAVEAAAEQAGGTGTFLDAIPTWWFWVLGGGVVVTVAGILLLPGRSPQKSGAPARRGDTTATVAA